MRRPGSPTVELLVLFVVVFVLQQVGDLLGWGIAWIALATPVAYPWTLVTSVYAHASINHLVVNAVALAVVGFALERSTTRVRFHAFVLVAGMLAGITELFVNGIVGAQVAVLGASGAILALYGYVIAGSPVVGGVLARVDVSRRAKLVLVAGIALLVTVLTAGPGVAVVAHFTGFALGLVAGRLRLLRVG